MEAQEDNNLLEKQKLAEAAESLKNIDFTTENYKEILEIINRISAISASNRHDEEIERTAISEQDAPPEVSPNDKTNRDGNDIEESESNFPTQLQENADFKEPIVFGKTVLPAFAIMTNKGLMNYSNAIVESYNEADQTYILNNGKEKVILPKKTFETILSPESAYANPHKLEKATIAEGSPSVVASKTILPEFAMITQRGIKSYKNFTLQSHNEAENSYTITDGDTTLTVPSDTFQEIIKPERFVNQFDENTPAHKKLLQTQYESYSKDRDNTANNFRHNLSVHCRKECSSPLESLKVAQEIISRMSKDEQQKTRNLLNLMKKEDETINQLIVRTYFEAIKEVPLNEEYIRQNFPDKKITRPPYDTLTAKGSLVDRDSNLRIGDTIHDIAFNVDKILGHGKEKLYETLTVVSASKENNSVLLMDKNKSYYEVPRDTLLENYNKQQQKEHRQESRHRKSYCVDIER